MIAVSSLVSYDVYRKYFNPDCTGKQLLTVSRLTVLGYGLFSGFLAWFLDGVDVNLGWVYNFMGIIIGSAVVPVSYCILWDRCTGFAAILGAWSGMFGAIFTWLAIASTECDENTGQLVDGIFGDEGIGQKVFVECDRKISVYTLGQLEAQLGGNLVAIGLSAIVCTIVSVWQTTRGGEKKFDWQKLREGIKLIEDAQVHGGNPDEMSEVYLDKAGKWISKYGLGYTFVLIIVWPVVCIPLGVFDKSIYCIWAAVAFVWGWTASIIIIALPIIENWTTIYGSARLVLGFEALPTTEVVEAKEVEVEAEKA